MFVPPSVRGVLHARLHPPKCLQHYGNTGGTHDLLPNSTEGNSDNAKGVVIDLVSDQCPWTWRTRIAESAGLIPPASG